MKRGLLLFVCFVVYADVDINKDFSWDDVYPPKNALFKKEWAGTWIKDFINIWKNTISIDTLTILSFMVPIYFGMRGMDKDLHSCFYDGSCHKNLHQMPRLCCEVSDCGIVAIMGILASFQFWVNDQELRLTSFVYAQAAVAYFIAKYIVKEAFKGSCHNLRPRNERFPNCDTYGGFPSGHTGEAALAAIIFGLRHGPAWGIPLGIYTAIVFGVSIGSNRHYASQTIAGLGLGIIFGLAAYRVLESKLPPNWDCKVCPADNRLAFDVGYSF